MSCVATPMSSPTRARPQIESASQLASRGAWPIVMLAGVCAWLHYTAHGYRLPWTPLEVSDADAGSALRQVLFAGVGALACYGLVARRALMLTLAHQAPWFTLAAGLVLSATWSDDLALTLKRSLIFSLGLLALASCTHAFRNPIAVMQRCVVGSAACVGWGSVAMTLALPAECSSITTRPGLAGLSSHPNTLGAVMLAGWLISLGITTTRRRDLTLKRLAQAGMLIALAMTGSVTCILAAVVGTCVFAVLSCDGYRRGVLTLLSVALGAIIWLVGPSTVKSAFFSAAGRDESLSGRDTLWATVYQAGLDRPIFGSGYGGFWTEGKGRELTGTWNPRQAHQAYIDLFVDLGAVGAFAVLALIVCVLWTGWRRYAGRTGSVSRRGMASLIALPVAMGTVYGMSQSFFLKLDQFAMLTLLWVLVLLTNRDDQNPAAEWGHAQACSDSPTPAGDPLR